jgi:diguanylate cyclase (GGDEF)-like protein/PAS domain S-box-containing protein
MTLKGIVSSKSTPLSGEIALMDALKQMERDQVSSVVVVDERYRPIGIFTEHDTLKTISGYDPSAVTLSEVMTRGVFCMDENTVLHDAYLAMEEKKYRHLVVTDGEGRYRGVVSEGDFLRHMGFEHLVKFKRVQDAMNAIPLLMGKEATIADAAAQMREAGKDYVLILENQTPYGVVSERDIARFRIHGDQDETESVSALAHTELKLVCKSTPLQEAAIVMQDHGIHQLIVVEEQNRFIGILDRHDILKALHGAYFEFLIATIEQKSEALEKLSLKEGELKAEKEIAERNMLKFRTLFESQPDGCALLRPDTVAVEFNDAMCRMLGYTREEFAVLRVNDYEVLESVEETEQRIRKIIQEGPESFESRHRRKDGSMIDVWVNVVAMQIDGEPYLMAMYRDISDKKQIQTELARKSSFLYTLINTIPDLIWLKDLEGTYLACNKMFQRFYNAQEGDIIGKNDFDFVDPALAQFFRDHDLAAVAAGGSRTNEEYLKFGDGSYEGFFETIKTPMKDAAGEDVGVLGVARDISDRKKKENEIKRVQELAHIGTWEWDILEDIFEGSEECFRMHGLSPAQAVSMMAVEERIYEEDRAEFTQAIAHVLWDGMCNMVYRVIDAEKELRWVQLHAEFQFDENGRRVKGIGIVQEITERVRYEKQLETLANYDSLTGLANRSFLMAHLQQSIAKGAREKTMTALFLFDLDRFKDINDSFGHTSGDELLQKVAQRFAQRLRAGDLIARLGGDEFAVVLEQIARPEDAGRFAEEMIRTLAAPFKLQSGIGIHISTSIGIVLSPQDGSEAETLLQNADAALYKAKAEGRGNYRYYTDDLTDSARQRVDCEVQLRRAIEQREFEVYYQPQVHIATGRIVGAEALVRWNDPQRGVISPAQFIPLAEETGMIGVIGEWVLNETCRQGKIWLDQGHRLILAVNLSAHQIRHQNIPEMVDKALKTSGYPAGRLELELTESALMQREEETVTMLHALRARGIRLAIDDFGTGYSSLSYLKRFPIDVLKIDKSFIDDLPYDQDDMAIVSAVIAMGEALGFQLLAEGVEHEEQLAFLRQRGCTMYQGYLKSRPLPASEFETLFSND